jgi:hypothetical protein
VGEKNVRVAWLIVEKKQQFDIGGLHFFEKCFRTAPATVD